MTRRGPSPKQLAGYLRDLAKKLDTQGALALDRASLLAARGYPASTGGNGSRSSDTTSSTERAALNTHPWAGIDDRLATQHHALWKTALDLEHTVDDILTHGTDRDVLPPGTGYCCCGCETYCSPRQNGPDDRLKAGLAPSCHRRFLRWRQDNDPTATVADYRTAARRQHERAIEDQQRIAQIQAELHR